MNQEQLRSELKTRIDNKGFSCNSAAHSMGVSASTLSQWLAGKYNGDNEKMAATVAQFLQRLQEKKAHPKQELRFVATTISKRVFEVARLCHLDGEIGICYGDAGLGKTKALKEYAAQNSDVILVEADLGYSAKTLFSELHKRLGFDGLGHINGMKEDVIAKLRNTGRLIIVDEAEHLPYRALELVRRLNDKAGVGILLAGMPRLISNLRGKKGEYAQLYSRVGVASRLDSLKPHDTEEIVNTMISDKNIHRAFHEASGGNTRVLTKLMMRAMRVSKINKMPITPELVHETAKMLII